MEIFGVLILFGALAAVIYYLDLSETVMKGFKWVGTQFTDAALQIETANNERRHIRKQKKQEAITAAFKKAADEKTRARQAMDVWRKKRQLKDVPPTYSHVKVHSNGAMSVDPGQLLRSPEVQRQLQGMDRLFKGETLRALMYGKTPPNAVGKGRYTIESLKRDWNDDWQAVADDLNIDLFPKKKPSNFSDVVFSNDTPMHMTARKRTNEINQKIEFEKKKIELERLEIKKLRAQISEMKTKIKKAKTGTSGGGPR